MDEDYYPVELQGEVFWWEKQIPVNRSAFAPFSSLPRRNFVAKNDQNLNKRMIEFLRRQWTWTPRIDVDRERNHRHMMNERMRRENQKQGYMALHSVLPNGTKSDKHSIVQMAGQRLWELQREEEELRRKNMELQGKLEAKMEEKTGEAKIRVKLDNPTSGVDSLLSLLQHLKNLGVKISALRSNLSAQEFSAEVVTQTQMGDHHSSERGKSNAAPRSCEAISVSFPMKEGESDLGHNWKNFIHFSR